MTRRRLLPLLLLPVLLAPGAQAASTAEEAAVVEFFTRSAGHTYDLQLVALNGGRIRVELADVGTGDRLGTFVGTGSLQLAPTTATLRTVLGTVPLTVRWTRTPNSLTVGGGTGRVRGTTPGPLPEAEVGYYAFGDSATARLTLGERSCTAEHFSLIGHAVVVDGTAARPLSALPKGLLTGGCTDATGDYLVG